MPSLTRRGLFAVGGAGAAGLAIAGCGNEEDPRAEGRDGELLNAAADAEAKLGAIYDGMAEGTKATPELAAFQKASAARRDELNKLGADNPDVPAASGVTMVDVIPAASAAVAAYREGAAFLSTADLRTPQIEFLTQVSSEQAVVRGLQDQDQSPTAFVTGLEEKPYVASDDTTSTTSSTTTGSSSTTTTTTSTGE